MAEAGAEGDDKTRDRGAAGGAEWERLQQAFLSQWFGATAEPTAPFAPWQALGETFGNAAAAGGAAAQSAGAPWQSFRLFADLLGEQAAQLRAGRRRKVDVAAALTALLESLVRNIDVAIAAQAMLAGDKAMGLAPFGLPRDFADWPALGLTRDWQLRVQRWWHALAAEREAGAHLRTLQWRALRAGCERCKRALAAPGPAITTLRGLYDLFVDNVELAWRETAMTDEYARAFGASANASLALRLALRDCVQPFAGLLELAGRAELDAIDRRLRDVEAAVREAPAPQASAGTEAAAAPTRETAPARKGGPRPVAAPKQAAPRRRTERTRPAAAKPASRRSEFDIASMIARGDEHE